MNKIALIVDKEESYVNNKKNELMSIWGEDNSNLKVVKKWTNGITVPDLFGVSPVINLDLSSSADRKEFQSWYQKNSKKLEDNWYGQGLIISISGGAPVTTVLERIIKENNGITFKEKNNEKIKEEILSITNLKPEEKEFLILYSGDDYSMLIPVINSIKSLSKKQQEELDTKDLLSMLPQKPGAKPPWEFVNYIFTGNLKEALIETQNSLEHYHPILLFSFVDSSVSAMMKSFYARNVLNTYKYKEQEKILGIGKIKNFYNGFNSSYGISEKALLYILKETHSAENMYKGGSGIDIKNHFLTLVYKITKIISNFKK